MDYGIPSSISSKWITPKLVNRLSSTRPPPFLNPSYSQSKIHHSFKVLLLLVTLAWKNLMFLSPSLSQLTLDFLDFWILYISSSLWASFTCSFSFAILFFLSSLVDYLITFSCSMISLILFLEFSYKLFLYLSSFTLYLIIFFVALYILEPSTSNFQTFSIVCWNPSFWIHF